MMRERSAQFGVPFSTPWPPQKDEVCDSGVDEKPTDEEDSDDDQKSEEDKDSDSDDTKDNSEERKSSKSNEGATKQDEKKNAMRKVLNVVSSFKTCDASNFAAAKAELEKVLSEELQ